MSMCEDLVKALEDRIQWTTTAAASAEEENKAFEAQVDSAKASLKNEADVRGGLQVCSSRKNY
jgi:hypothetical protein